MRIAIISEYFYPDSTGGSGTVLSKLVRQLKDAHDDLEIDVITSKNLFRGKVGRLAAHENWDGVNIVRLSTPQPRKKSMKRRLVTNLLFTAAIGLKLLKSPFRYDLVLVTTAPSTLSGAARVWSFLTGKPYIYLIYDLYLDLAIAMKMVAADSKTVKVFRGVQTQWFHKAARTIVLGRCMQAHVARTYALPLEKMCVIPIPTDSEAITPRDKQTQFRANNNLSGFVVLYAGNFAQYQDFKTLLDAAQRLVDDKDITFVFVGDGSRKEYIAERIAQDGLSNVRLLPFVPEAQLCDLLASADASLVTLEKGAEGLAVPSKFYNIMASGRPTIAVVDSHCEVGRVVSETRCGVRVDPEEPAQLAQAIRDLAASPKYTNELGRNARHACEERYTVENIADQFYNLFQEVAQPLVTKLTKRELRVQAKQSAECETARK